MHYTVTGCSLAYSRCAGAHVAYSHLLPHHVSGNSGPHSLMLREVVNVILIPSFGLGIVGCMICGMERSADVYSVLLTLDIIRSVRK